MEAGSDSFYVRSGCAVDIVVVSLLFQESTDINWHTIVCRLETVCEDNSRTSFGSVSVWSYFHRTHTAYCSHEYDHLVPTPRLKISRSCLPDHSHLQLLDTRSVVDDELQQVSLQAARQANNKHKLLVNQPFEMYQQAKVRDNHSFVRPSDFLEPQTEHH